MSNRKIDPAKACLALEKWPATDQTLWNELVCGDNFESESERPNWRPSTRQANREGYGRFLNYLTHLGVDLQSSPAGRVTPENVRGYLRALAEQGVSVQTQANRALQLLAVIRVFAPKHDWDWLKRRYNRLALMAKDQRQQRPLTMFSGDILSRTLKALNETKRNGSAPQFAAAIEYRNWLMVATLALTSLRRHNFSDLSIEKHLRRSGGSWSLEIPGKQAKGKRAISMPVPALLRPHIQFYLENVRPRLLAGRSVDGLWISDLHTAMTSHSVYIAITNFTRKVFGQAINPHRFRHIAATTVVAASPENIEAARALLTHTQVKMTEDHYVIGSSLVASRQHAELIAELRRRYGDRPAVES
jgi:site-specific recombinase XerD